MKAFITGQQKRVTHPDDTDSEPTVFVIQAIPRRGLSYIQDKSFLTTPEGTQYHAGRATLLTTQLGLADVENLYGPNGKPVKIEKVELDLYGGAKHTCVAEEVLDLIPPPVAAWLVTQINKFANVTEQEVGKSDASSSE